MPRKLRVLVVEDDQVLSRAFARALRDWSVDVIEASNLADGRKALKDHPDLVILDILLPDGSGVSLAEDMSLMVPVPMSIAISGQATAAEAFKLKELGVLGFLPKPLSLDDLTSTLDSLLQTPPDIAPQLRAYVGKKPFRDVQLAVRRSMVEQALGMANGNLTHTARLLNVSRQAVQHMIRDLKLVDYHHALNLHQEDGNNGEEES